ncbi:MAG: hypothetical protein ACYSUY_01410 [Planctomycetota bacterium]|jgi:hypothetical protein
MIKTLRITTIIAAILAIGFLAFPVVYGYRGDEQIEQFLKSPGAIEKFNKAKGAKSRKTGNQISPLVQQATMFGLYINPPPRKAAPRPKTTTVARKQAPVIPEPPRQSAKFKLIGTSYYASRPELSLAYINEPGKGLYWVRQGAKVGHLLIEQVQDGSVVVKDRETTVTLVAVRAPKKSLIKGETTSKSTPPLPGASTSITSSLPVQVSAGKSAKSALGKAAAVPPKAVPHGASRRRPPQMSAAEGNAALADFINRLKATPPGEGKTDSKYSTGEKATLKEAIATFETTRITTKEANRLVRLGKQLKSDPNRAGNSKIQRSGGPQPPRPPQPPGKPTRRLPR